MSKFRVSRLKLEVLGEDETVKPQTSKPKLRFQLRPLFLRPMPTIAVTRLVTDRLCSDVAWFFNERDAREYAGWLNSTRPEWKPQHD